MKKKTAYNKTFLSIDQAEKRGFIHRDYIAHCLRWTHVIKCIGASHKEQSVLDIGCGKLMPFGKLLYTSRMIPMCYVGVDMNVISPDIDTSRCDWMTTFGKTNFLQWSKENKDKRFSIIVCFEVLEHMPPKKVVRFIKAIRRHLSDNGTAFISTPCWDMKHCADNHPNEMKYEVVGSLLERHSLTIQEKYGTFASIADYKDHLSTEQHDVFNDLREYYDVNMLSCIMAPLFPQYSRNVLWVVKKGETDCRYFDALETIPTPWSSNPNYKELANE